MSSFNNIQDKNILVIGDVMIDTYYYGKISRISPEAPVPVFKRERQRSVLGGAANVAANLIAAGQNVSMMSIVGNDDNGSRLIDEFARNHINTDLIIRLDRRTSEKTRFLAGNNQQVLRMDVEDTDPITAEETEALLTRLEDRIDSFDLILISDYMKGLLTYEFTQGVIRLANNNNIPVVVDVKDPQKNKYDGAFLLKPNLKEIHDLTGLPVGTDEEIIHASNVLREECHNQYVLTTCGAKGMVLVGDGDPYFIEPVKQEVFDVTGAGDTTIAYLAACLVNGFDIREAVDIADTAAGIQVSKVGTSSVYWHEVRQYLSREDEGVLHKLISDKAIDSIRENYKDKKIVFTNGCFDIMHVGHLRYLQEAAKLGDILIVGLNSDASVRRLKGPERPINSEMERAEMMAALGFVDYVAIFDEDTPLELIKKVQPDVLVKGGDYSNEYVVGTNEVEARGGRLVLIPFVEGKSTTNIINRIRE